MKIIIQCAGGENPRAKLLAYNQQYQQNGANPEGLLPAWQLYTNKTYAALVEKYGIDGVYILSAGWGLIAVSFLTPNYDITFSPSADKYKRRHSRDKYEDWQMLPNSAERIIFFGGKSYLNMFCELTQNHSGERIVYYNAKVAPIASGVTLKKYQIHYNTNWHYACAQKFMADELA